MQFKTLIVEDNLTDLHFFRAALSQLPLEIDVAYDGLIGYEKLASGNHDLVLLDLLLPNANGVKLLQQAEEKKVKLPIVIVCSNLSGENYIMQCLQLGASGYLVKPILPTMLVNSVCDYLSITPPTSQVVSKPVISSPTQSESLSLSVAMAKTVGLKNSTQILVETEIGIAVLEYDSGKLTYVKFDNLYGIPALEKIRKITHRKVILKPKINEQM